MIFWKVEMGKWKWESGWHGGRGLSAFAAPSDGEQEKGRRDQSNLEEILPRRPERMTLLEPWFD